MNKTIRNTLSMSVLSAFLLLGSQSALACANDGPMRPEDKVTDTVNQLFLEKNYRQLDKLYRDYSVKGAAAPDGISALSLFFRGVAKSFVGCAKSQRTDQEWQAQKAALLAWQSASPTSSAPKLALALYTVNHGWYARGQGSYSTVGSSARTLFERRMADAKRQFEKMAPLAKDNPAWYSGMLHIGLAQGWSKDKFEPLYIKAVNLDPYFMNFHVLNKEYHAPQWYGSDQEMQDAVDIAVDLTKERLGQAVYARLYTDAWKPDSMFTSGAVSWARMKKGFEDDLAVYSDLKTRRNFANYACVADDANTLKQQLDVLGDQAAMTSWGNNRHVAYCTGLATMAGTDRKPRCFKFDDADEYVCD